MRQVNNVSHTNDVPHTNKTQGLRGTQAMCRTHSGLAQDPAMRAVAKKNCTKNHKNSKKIKFFDFFIDSPISSINARTRQPDGQ